MVCSHIAGKLNNDPSNTEFWFLRKLVQSLKLNVVKLGREIVHSKGTRLLVLA